MAKATKRRRTRSTAVATAPRFPSPAPAPRPSSSPSPSLSPAPPSPSLSPAPGPANDHDADAIFEYLKFRGFASTLAALTADLSAASAADKIRTGRHLSASSLIWANDDIATEVVSFLGSSDLRSCLTVSRAFNRAATPLLYRKINERLPNCHCRPPPERDHALVARYTTALEVFPHHHVQHYRAEIDVPRLRTLVLNYDADSKAEMTLGKGSALHSCRFCPPKLSQGKAERVVVRPIAGLFKGKKPATVIVVPTATTNGANFYHRHQTIAPETVVHIARMTSQTKYSRAFWMQPREPTAAQARSITFVLLPIMWDHGPIGNRRPPWGEAKAVGNLGASLIDAITEYCLHFGDHRVKIVGLEDANPFAMPDHWAARAERKEVFEKAFNDKLEALMTTSFRYGKWSDEQREWRRNSISLTTFTDYLRSAEWGEEMDWQLVGRWLNTYELRECGQLGTLAVKPKRKAVARKPPKSRKRKSVVLDESENDDSQLSDDSADSDYVM